MLACPYCLLFIAGLQVTNISWDNMGRSQSMSKRTFPLVSRKPIFCTWVYLPRVEGKALIAEHSPPSAETKCCVLKAAALWCAPWKNGEFLWVKYLCPCLISSCCLAVRRPGAEGGNPQYCHNPRWQQYLGREWQHSISVSSEIFWLSNILGIWKYISLKTSCN